MCREKEANYNLLRSLRAFLLTDKSRRHGRMLDAHLVGRMPGGMITSAITSTCTRLLPGSPYRHRLIVTT
jgi:hypothetical protein